MRTGKKSKPSHKRNTSAEKKGADSARLKNLKSLLGNEGLRARSNEQFVEPSCYILWTTALLFVAADCRACTPHTVPHA